MMPGSVFRLLRGGLPFLLAALAANACAQQAAAIVFATGSARIVAADGAARPAVRGAAVSAGDTVDTADGRAQLRFLDGALISLQPATQFRVEQFRFADQGGRAAPEDHVAMRFLKGALRAVSGLIGREKNEQYRMDTAVGTIGIRGTDYAALLGDDGLSLTTYSGRVEVCNTAGCAQAGPGQTLRVPDIATRPQLQGGAPSPAMPPGAAMPELPPAQVAPQPSAPTQPDTHVSPPTYDTSGRYY